MNRLTSRLILALPLLLLGCSDEHSHPQSAKREAPLVASVRAQSVETRNFPSEQEVVGTVRARLHATLEARVSGRISEMPVRLGQPVKAGDRIALLEAGEIKARLLQAEATLRQTERDWQRAKDLWAQQTITRAEYDNVESRHLVAQGALAEAQAMVNYVDIKAPFAGVITRKWAELGDLATLGKPLVELQDPSSLQLEAQIPEALADRVKPEARLKIRAEGMASDVWGMVEEIAPASDPVSRTVQVKVALADNSNLRPGQFARLVVPIGETRSLQVPTSAVVQRGQMEIVFVVANNMAQLHLVKTGRRHDKAVEITSGLDESDRVVIEGAAGLVDQQPLSFQ